MKKLLLVLFVLSFSTVVFGQQTIEQQVADTACGCISQIDTTLNTNQGSAKAMLCLQQAMYKNQKAIKAHLEGEKRKEDELEKRGIQGSILIKVQNVLQKSCPAYKRYNSKLQERRVP